jgi:hypothetical protein
MDQLFLIVGFLHQIIGAGAAHGGVQVRQIQLSPRMQIRP